MGLNQNSFFFSTVRVVDMLMLVDHEINIESVYLQMKVLVSVI